MMFTEASDNERLRAKSYWDEIDPNVVRIQIEYKGIHDVRNNARSGSGTGNIIANEGGYMLINTCGHVLLPYLESVLDVRRLVIQFNNGQTSSNFQVVSSIKDAKLERGLLFGYGGKGVMNLKPAVFAARPPTVGMQIYMGSYPYSVYSVWRTKGTLSNPNVPGDSLALP